MPPKPEVPLPCSLQNLSSRNIPNFTYFLYSCIVLSVLLVSFFCSFLITSLLSPVTWYILKPKDTSISDCSLLTALLPLLPSLHHSPLVEALQENLSFLASVSEGSNIYFLYFHHNPYKYVVNKILDTSHKVKERKLAFSPSDVNC